MQTAVIIIGFVVLIWIEFAVPFQGLDLRKRSDWLYGILAFLSGLVLGTAINGNLIDGLGTGTIFAFLTLFTGVMSRRHKQKYGRWTATKSLVRKYEKEDNPSLFAKLVKKLFDKYK
jgi:hypothetical protein